MISSTIEPLTSLTHVVDSTNHLNNPASHVTSSASPTTTGPAHAGAYYDPVKRNFAYMTV
jgi:hypothetical protein